MDKFTRNIVIGAVAAVAGIGMATAVSYKLTKKLLSIAMDRKEPEIITKSRSRLAGSDSGIAELSDAVSESAQKLESSDSEDVVISGQDGTILIGHWRTCANPKRVIIAMHGWRSSWSHDFGSISDFWHDNNCCVLYAEQRGQGGSGGDYIGFGLLERYDCLNWIKWVNERTNGELPVYLAGVSMGATTVLMTAGFDLPKNVKGIIADCGFTSPHAIWRHVVEHNLRIPYKGIRGAIANDMCKRKINIGAKDYSAVDAMRKCEVPVLFIHGTNDRFVPIEMTYENYKACTAPKRLFVVPDAEHAMSYFNDKDNYEKVIIDFWKDFDR